MTHYAIVIVLLLTSVTACANSEDSEDGRTNDSSVSLDARMEEEHSDASSSTDLRTFDVGGTPGDTRTHDAFQGDEGINQRDAFVVDLSTQRDAGIYIEVMGDISARDECNVVCAGVSRICDGQYEHFLFGAVGGTVMHEDVGGELTCDERPEETITPPFDGKTRRLTSYVCYCREA